MANTRLEPAIRGMDSDTLEQLAADLLQREGYDVEPTSTSGPDNGRDAFAEKSNDEEQGIVHCSVQKDKIEDKIKDDADKAAKHNQDYDFFIFFTTQDRATVMRDRLEEEVSEEYGFRTRIWDFETMRNKLMGDTENHDLAYQHLRVDPAGILTEVKSQLDRLEDNNQLEQLQNQPRINIDSWEVTTFDELVPLTAPDSIAKTQTQLSFNISNVGKGNAYNLRSCLYAKPIYDISSPPTEEIREELLSAEPTSKLRRDGREPERDAKNYLESSESAEFLSNTFVYMHGRKGHAFGVSTTGPFPPEATQPEGFAVGVKLVYDDEFDETHQKVLFSAIGGVPDDTLHDFFMKLKAIVRMEDFETIFPEDIQFG